MMDLNSKYRPIRISDVLGNDAIKTIVKNFVKRGKNQPLLFSSSANTPGIGKTTLARLVARLILCENFPANSDDTCGTCKNCKNLASGDLCEIDGASNNKVEDIRSLLETINYEPLEATKRIIIIDEVHMLSKAAFNVLLKTIEEPPKNALFIFCTTEKEKIPDTIISRCMSLDVTRPKFPEILERLVLINGVEEFNISENSLKKIVIKTKGIVRDAIKLLETASLLTENELNNYLEIPDENDIAKWVQILLYDNLSNRLKLIDDELLALPFSFNTIMNAILEYIVHVRFPMFNLNSEIFNFFNYEMDYTTCLMNFQTNNMRLAIDPYLLFTSVFPNLAQRLSMYDSIKFNADEILSKLCTHPAFKECLVKEQGSDFIQIQTKAGSLVEISATGNKANDAYLSNASFFIQYPIDFLRLLDNPHLTGRELLALKILQPKKGKVE